MGFDLNRRTEGPLQNVRHALDQLIGVDDFRVERLLARKGQEATHKPRRPICASFRRRAKLFALRDSLCLAPQEPEAGDDDGQKVVEIVRNAAGKVP